MRVRPRGREARGAGTEGGSVHVFEGGVGVAVHGVLAKKALLDGVALGPLIRVRLGQLLVLKRVVRVPRVIKVVRWRQCLLQVGDAPGEGTGCVGLWVRQLKEGRGRVQGT